MWTKAAILGAGLATAVLTAAESRACSTTELTPEEDMEAARAMIEAAAIVIDGVAVSSDVGIEHELGISTGRVPRLAEDLLHLMASGMTESELYEARPDITPEDMDAVDDYLTELTEANPMAVYEEAEIRVTRAWKGAATERLVVRAQIYCTEPVTPGESYFVLVSADPDTTLWTTSETMRERYVAVLQEE